MKTLLLTMLFSQITFAMDLPVNVRGANKKIEVQKISIPNLESGLAENEHFKVTKSIDADALEITSKSNKEDLLKAGTVLHHLNIARNYFINVLNSEYASELPQITVRLDMAKPFNENFHYLETTKDESFNNAVTIPAASNKAMPDVNKWGMEIWFRPAKAIKVDNPVYQTGKYMDQINTWEFVKSIGDQSVNDVVIHSVAAESLAGIDYMAYIGRILVTVGIFEVIPKAMMVTTKSLKSDAYLDTAMIPEVVYHEYSHAALSDFVSVRKSTPLNEGMANYFAAVISNNAKIADKNGDHSKNVVGYNGKSSGTYEAIFETKASGQTNFVFSFLWRLRTRLNKEYEGGDLLADKLIFNSRKYVRYAERPIKDDLIPSLVDSASDVIAQSQVRKLRMIINEVAVKAGL